MDVRDGRRGGLSFSNGAMAQLVAHLLCKQGVTGSSPVSSTPRTLIFIQSERPFVLPGRVAFGLVIGGFLGRVTPAQKVDHIVPLERGGTHDKANLQALCKPCHSSKTAREDDRWRQTPPQYVYKR